MNRTTVSIVLFSWLMCPPLATTTQAVPPGFEVVDVTRDPSVRFGPRDLNNCGQAVFYGRFSPSWSSAETFLYDSGRTIQITDNNDRDVTPQISESGAISWLRGVGADGISQLLKLEQGTEELLVDYPAGLWDGRVNGRGQYAWVEGLDDGCRGANTRLMFFDGAITRQVTSGNRNVQLTDMNDSGGLVWVEPDFCQEHVPYRIMYYADGIYTEIGAEHESPVAPRINNRSQIAYLVWDWEAFDYGIWVWEDGVSRPVVPAPASTCSINDRGDITFQRRNPPGGEYGQPWLYYADTGDITPLLEADFHQGVWAINDHREILIASVEFGQNYQIRLMRRIRTGDSEFDGDVDIDDFARLVECMTGPMWVERTNPGPQDSLCDCRFLDINHDGSVDLRDYAVFQQNFEAE